MAQVATLGECKPWFWSAQSSGFAIYLLIYVRPTSDKNALKQYTWQSVNMTTSDIIGGTNFTPLDLFKMLTHFGHFTLRSATPIQDMNIHSAKSIGGKDTSAPIYWR